MHNDGSPALMDVSSSKRSKGSGWMRSTSGPKALSLHQFITQQGHQLHLPAPRGDVWEDSILMVVSGAPSHVRLTLPWPCRLSTPYFHNCPPLVPQVSPHWHVFPIKFHTFKWASLYLDMRHPSGSLSCTTLM